MAAAAAVVAPLGPSDVGAVLQALQAALQQDPAARRPAEQALAALETRPGFCSCLAEVIAARPPAGAVAGLHHSGGAEGVEGPDGARWLAAVYFKNAVSRYWRARRGDGPAVPDGERSALRGRLLALAAEEPVDPVAVQLAVLVARVARTDFPREWPGLFGDALALLQRSKGQGGGGGEMLASRRLYLVLHHVLKARSSPFQTFRIATSSSHSLSFTMKNETPAKNEVRQELVSKQNKT